MHSSIWMSGISCSLLHLISLLVVLVCRLELALELPHGCLCYSPIGTCTSSSWFQSSLQIVWAFCSHHLKKDTISYLRYISSSLHIQVSTHKLLSYIVFLKAFGQHWHMHRHQSLLKCHADHHPHIPMTEIKQHCVWNPPSLVMWPEPYSGELHITFIAIL